MLPFFDLSLVERVADVVFALPQKHDFPPNPAQLIAQQLVVPRAQRRVAHVHHQQRRIALPSLLSAIPTTSRHFSFHPAANESPTSTVC